MGSTVQNLAVAPIGKPLTARAIVTGNYDRKGHHFVEVDGLILSGGTPVARVAHTAIYRPRQAVAAEALGGRPAAIPATSASNPRGRRAVSTR